MRRHFAHLSILLFAIDILRYSPVLAMVYDELDLASNAVLIVRT